MKQMNRFFPNTVKTLTALLLIFVISCDKHTETNTILVVNPEKKNTVSLLDEIKAEVPTTQPREAGKQHIMIALLLDTSSSMDGLIDQAKSQLWKIINELAAAKSEDNKPPVLEIALYEYGNDNIPAEEGFIRMVTNLTTDLDELSDKLFGLTTQGGNEFCGEVIQTSINQLNWGDYNTDLKMIFIAGNEPFDQGNVTYQKACALAKEKGIFVNTIFCGGYDDGVSSFWRSGASFTGGSYMNINQNNQTVFIETPFDRDIDKLNSKLNETYVSYGFLGRTKKETQARQDDNAKSYGLANNVLRSISKTSSYYSNSSWDLVDAYRDSTFDYESIQKEHLSEELRELSEKELEVYITEKAKERAKVQQEIQDLAKKRTLYISENQPKTNSEGMLDQAMIQAIRNLAKSKNMNFND